MQLEELKNGNAVQSEKFNFDHKSSGARSGNDAANDPVATQRRERVKDAMIHAWSSYEKYAWGHDELQVLVTFLLNGH